jgi:hypothetical protein
MKTSRSRIGRLLAGAAIASALAVGTAAKPASAVIHEIYGAWCAGKGEISPPGLSDDTKASFAKPVIAGGVVSFTPYSDGVLIDFDFDKPQAKIVPAPDGPAIVQIGPGLYLERFILDPNFPGFLNCLRLDALAG